MSRFSSTAVLMLLAFGSPAWAQPQVSPLSLSEVLGLAQHRSLGILQSQHRLASVEAAREAAKAPLLPSLSLQSGTGLSSKAPQDPLDTTLTLNQLLWDSQAAKRTVAIAEDQVKIARWTLFQTEQDALQNAAIAYFQVLRAESLAEVAQDTLKQAQEHLRIGALRQKTGAGTRAEVLQLQARLAAARVSLISAQNGAVLARLSLANLVNAPIKDRPLVANTSLSAQPVRLERDLPMALEQRPEIQAQGQKVQSDLTREQLEGNAVLPSLSAVGKYNNTIRNGDLYAGINFNWPLFDGRKASSRVQGAKADTEADKALLEQLKLAADLEIRSQYQVREEAQSRVLASRDGVRAAQESYRLALHRYELGLATQTELADTQNVLVQARETAVQAEKDLAIAEVKLRRALGLDLAKL